MTGNSAREGGGAFGITLYFGSTLYNCTLTGNSAETSGGGATGCTLYNCTLTGNQCFVWRRGCLRARSTTASSTTTRGGNHSGSTFAYSCTTPLPPGEGNIDADPQLASAHICQPFLRASERAAVPTAMVWTSTGSHGPTRPAWEPTKWCRPATGPLDVQIEAAYTNVAVGFPVRFVAQIEGRRPGHASGILATARW